MPSRGAGAGSAATAGAFDAVICAVADRLAERVEKLLAELAPAGDSNRPLDRRGLAEFLGCSVDTVDKLRAEGLPRFRVGDCDRFERSVVLEWLRGRG